MHDYPDRYEPIRRAREMLRRGEDDDRRRRFEAAQRGPVDDLDCDAPPPTADWRSCKTTREMSTRQFAQWCDDGKPPLQPALKDRLFPVTRSKVAEMIRTAIAGERAAAQVSEDALVSILGDEVGRMDKRLLEVLRAEIDTLRTEVSTLRREFDSGVIELPGPPKDWRHAATH
jgi:hypothetical protein